MNQANASTAKREPIAFKFDPKPALRRRDGDDSNPASAALSEADKLTLAEVVHGGRRPSGVLRESNLSRPLAEALLAVAIERVRERRSSVDVDEMLLCFNTMPQYVNLGPLGGKACEAIHHAATAKPYELHHDFYIDHWRVSGWTQAHDLLTRNWPKHGAALLRETVLAAAQSSKQRDYLLRNMEVSRQALGQLICQEVQSIPGRTSREGAAQVLARDRAEAILAANPLAVQALKPAWTSVDMERGHLPLDQAMAHRVFEVLRDFEAEIAAKGEQLKPDQVISIANARSATLAKCDLTWLTPEMALKQIWANAPSPARYARLQNATDEQFRAMLIRMGSPFRQDVELLSPGDVRRLPRFHERAAEKPQLFNEYLMHGLGLLTLPGGAFQRALVNTRVIADAIVRGRFRRSSAGADSAMVRANRQGVEYLNKVVDLLFAAHEKAEPHMKRETARRVVEGVLALSGAATPWYTNNGDCHVAKADLGHVCRRLTESSMLRDLEDVVYTESDRVTDTVVDSLRDDMDSFVRKMMEECVMGKEVADTLWSTLVFNGAISLSGVRKCDLTVEKVGPMLRAQPERLAEVKHLDLFLKLARQLDIPVTVPNEGNAEPVSKQSRSARAPKA